MMDNMKEHATDDDKAFFDEKIEALKKMKEDDNYDGLDAIEEEIQRRWYAISAKAYSTGNNGQGGFNPQDIFNAAQTQGATPNNNEDDIEVQDAK